MDGPATPLINANATIIAARPRLRFPITEEREPGCPAETAHGVPDVPDDAFPAGSRPGFPHTLLDLFLAPQLDEGRAPCLLRSHARPDLRVGVVLDERAEFLTELSVARAAVPPTGATRSAGETTGVSCSLQDLSTAVVMDFQCGFSRASCFCRAFVIP